ncbi:MAG: fumarylacetoacetate hydrolase family protein [Microbacterium sp.]
MKIGNLRGRAVLLVDGAAVDIERASEGRFSADVDEVFRDWERFRSWASGAVEGLASAAEPFVVSDLRAPVIVPRQIFAIGLNYAEHAAETKLVGDRELVVFTKFATSLVGPEAEVSLPADTVDWEVEIAAVIGREAASVDPASAWQHVAGLAVSQDLSERAMQMTGVAPQFSLAKSFPGFSPVGPWVVTVDEFEDPDGIAFGCSVNGETVQSGTTAELIFSIPEIIAELSAVVTLLPGDLIFTGTPSGVGMARTPPVYLKPGDELVSWADGIGTIRTAFV